MTQEPNLTNTTLYAGENDAPDLSLRAGSTLPTIIKQEEELSHLVLKKDRYKISACDQCAKAKAACNVRPSQTLTDAGSVPDNHNIN